MIFCSLEDKNTKQSFVKSIITKLFIIAGIMFLVGLTNIYAAEDGTSENVDSTEISSTNATQDQKAELLAEQAASQDSAVIEAYAHARIAKNTEDTIALQNKANTLYNAKVAEYNDQISGMRASGMGWGEIAHELGVHPSVLGLGHSKRSETNKGFFAMLSRKASEVKASINNAFKGNNSKGQNVASSASKSKGNGSKSQGFALGSAKGEGSDHGNGHGGDHGNGHGGGNGGGNDGGNGGGNGGGNK